MTIVLPQMYGFYPALNGRHETVWVPYPLGPQMWLEIPDQPAPEGDANDLGQREMGNISALKPLKGT